MLISPKNSKEFIYKIILYSVGCAVLYIYGINLITVIVMAFFIIQIIWNIVDMRSCKQKAEYKLYIKDDILYFNTQKFPLANSYLFFNLVDCGKKISVSLYQEIDTKVVTVFESIVFNRTEFIEFFKLIRPYRKFRAFPWDKFNTNNSLYVCKDGFIICGREFFYSEVKKFDWKTTFHYEMTARIRIVTLYIYLQNGKRVKEAFHFAKWLIYAKILYIDMRVNNEKIGTATGHKKVAKAFNEILKELDKNGCESL